MLAYLDFLFYKVGKQNVDFFLQQQQQDKFMSKRRKYSDVGFSKDLKWLSFANARTIMDNEIVLDIDPLSGEYMEDFQERIVKVKKEILVEKEDKPDYWGIFQSNRGIHIHIWFNKMLYWDSEKRKRCRLTFIDKYKADKLKINEKVMIALEGAPHWKSGKIKKLIEGDLDGYYGKI